MRFPALQTKSIQATLFNTAMSLKAQKEGFTKLAMASDYANLIEGGLSTSNDRIKQSPDKIFRFIRASLKGLNFFVSKREPSIKYMTEALRMNDRELVNAIYDIQAKLVLRDGFTDDIGFTVDDRGDEKDRQSATRHQDQRHLRFDLREKSQRRTQNQRLETITAPRERSVPRISWA